MHIGVRVQREKNGTFKKTTEYSKNLSFTLRQNKWKHFLLILVSLYSKLCIFFRFTKCLNCY